ncbi:MAG: hypothetical protein RRC34_00915 [Lentisphaeria bacterium]|nr:hypothetical protein [Lentisphaeria bacterium]
MAHYDCYVRKTITESEKEAIFKRYPEEDGLIAEKIWKVVESGNERERLTVILYFAQSAAPREFLLPYVDQLMYVIENKAPSYHNYSDYRQTSGPGIETLANLNIREEQSHA